MKTTLFSLMLFTLNLWAMGQTTHDITWQQGVNGDNASLDIQLGDTVRWIWGDAVSHNVVSVDKDGAADFGSETITEEGYVYSYTFKNPAIIDYVSDLNPKNMYGRIVVSENSSTQAQEKLDFKIYPNPVKDRIFFENQSQFSDLDITIFDVLGKVVKHERMSSSTLRNGIEVSGLKRGIYLIQIDNGRNTFTQKLIKN